MIPGLPQGGLSGINHQTRNAAIGGGVGILDPINDLQSKLAYQ